MEGLVGRRGGYEKLSLEELVTYAECLRRSNDPRVVTVVRHLERCCENDESPETMRLLASGTYETGMFAFGQQDYDGAIAETERSIAYAERGGDRAGALQGKDNIGGLFLRNLRKLPEAKAVCLEVLDALQVARAKDAPNAARYDRVEMNILFHLMELGMDMSDRELVGFALAELEMNPLYQQAKETLPLREPVTRARAFLAPTEA